MPVFPTAEWIDLLVAKLNSDEQYARIARNWEGDMRFIIDPDGPLAETVTIYLDLWHGKCRSGFIELDHDSRQPSLILRAPYRNFARVITGDMDPMQALLTRKLGVKGDMSVLMRNIPVVLDFVRCAREITNEIL